MTASSSKRFKIYLSREKLEDILRSVGVKIVSETQKDFLCYCCFHHNTDTPAFNIEKREPYRWKCNNGKCNQKGNIYSLLIKKGYSQNEAKKLLVKGQAEISDLEALIKELIKDEQEHVNKWTLVDPSRFILEDQEAGYPALNYMVGRGISKESYEYFKIGYSTKRKMVVVPVYGENNDFIGVIGRTIEGKAYKYSAGLSRSTTIWNLQNVIQLPSDSIILTEGYMDSIYIHQAGYWNVGAILGSAISPQQWFLLRKYFSEIILFFDNDDPGRALRDSIINSVRDLSIGVVEYPGDQKDPEVLSEQQIRYMIENRKSSIEYLL